MAFKSSSLRNAWSQKPLCHNHPLRLNSRLAASDEWALKGAEAIENGILLRAGLHRLYDKSCFAINLAGQVKNIQNVSNEYQLLLQQKRLPEDIVRRVQEALQHQWKARA